MQNLKLEFSGLSQNLKRVFLVAVLVGVVSIISNLILIDKLQDASNPALAAQQEIEKVVAEVGRFLVLPDDETPTMATVTDPSRLTGQPFFAKAKVGDKVLIYSNAKKAVLWRPSTKQVIEVSSVNIAPPAGE